MVAKKVHDFEVKGGKVRIQNLNAWLEHWSAILDACMEA